MSDPDVTPCHVLMSLPPASRAVAPYLSRSDVTPALSHPATLYCHTLAAVTCCCVSRAIVPSCLLLTALVRLQVLVLLAVALRRLGFCPQRAWAEGLLHALEPSLRATCNPQHEEGAVPEAAMEQGSGERQPAGQEVPAQPLPPESVAALLVALAGMRVRPSDAWMELAVQAVSSGR